MQHKGLWWLVRIVTLLACLGVFALTVGKYLFIRYLLKPSGVSAGNASSIGIIGSADGPTSIFISPEKLPWLLPSLAATAVAGVIALLVFHKTKRR